MYKNGQYRISTGYPWEIDSATFSLGVDFDIQVLPWGRKFDIAMTCFGQKAAPRGGNLTFSRCPGVGNLALALVKLSNSLGSARPTLGLNIDRCISLLYKIQYLQCCLYKQSEGLGKSRLAIKIATID